MTQDSKAGLTALPSIIRELMRRKGNINQAELSRQTAIPTPTLHKLLNGQTVDPRASTLMILARFFDVGLDQLAGLKPLGGDKAMRHISVSIPVVTWERAAECDNPAAGLDKDNWDEWTIVEEKRAHCYALYSKPSMEPLFPRGSVLVVNPDLKASDGDYVIVVYPDTQAATMREISLDGNIKELLPLTPGSKREPIPEGIEILGVVKHTVCDFV